MVDVDAGPGGASCRGDFYPQKHESVGREVCAWELFVWMAQAARNLTDCMDGFLKGKRYLIVDRDALFSDQFKAILRSSGTKIVRTSIQAPNMNAFVERFVLSIKSECLDRMIFLGGESLDRAIREFMIHYHGERPHQGLENALIAGGPTLSEGRVEVRDRLGGLLKYYYREAA